MFRKHIGALVVLVLLGSSCRSVNEERPSLLVGSAISLRPTLDRVIRLYGTVRPDVDVHVSYAGTGTIRHQISFGAPIDIFLSASSDHLDTLIAHHLVLPATRHTIARNSLVLIMPVRRAPIGSMLELQLPSISKIAMGDPSVVPAGRYAVEVLESAGLIGGVREKFVFTKDVLQTLVYVRTGIVDAGFVYATDARLSPPVRTIVTVPDSLCAPILYEGAITTASRNKEEATRFLAYLVSDSVQALFESEGYRHRLQ